MKIQAACVSIVFFQAVCRDVLGLNHAIVRWNGRDVAGVGVAALQVLESCNKHHKSIRRTPGTFVEESHSALGYV